jgi:hypothetical protein
MEAIQRRHSLEGKEEEKGRGERRKISMLSTWSEANPIPGLVSTCTQTLLVHLGELAVGFLSPMPREPGSTEVCLVPKSILA